MYRAARVGKDSIQGPRFVDTNILVYAHDASAGDKHDIARDLITELWNTRLGCLSVQVLQEFYVVATTKVRMPLSRQLAKQIISGYSDWPVHSPVAADIVRSVDIQERYGIPFWDAMIIQSAVRLGSSIIWSEDLSSGQIYEGVTAKNPFSVS